MNQQFSIKRSYPKFLKYILPSIVTMIFLSFYTTIDGFFVSRFVNSNALAAINIVIPLTCVFFGISVMISSGSGAIVGVKMGEGRKKEANSIFTFMMIVLAVIGVVITALGIIFLDQILILLGATEVLMPYAKPYGFLTVLMTLPMMFKLFFEYYTRVDGNPTISLIMSATGLVLNLVLDFIFIAILHMGILGAALGTFLSIVISALIGLFHFIKGKGLLKFAKPKYDSKALLHACYNGSSEMFTEFSTGITTFLFNIAILKYHGENGVAAMSIITYLYYFFTAAYFGISVGISPIISYNYGAKNKDLIKQNLRYSMITILWSSIAVFLVSILGGGFIIQFFSDSKDVYNIALYGLRLFSFCFLFCGINIFMSGFFTSVCNGKISAIISILRSLVFVVVNISVLPTFLGVSGIWLSIPFAEIFTIVFSLCFYFKYRKQILG